MQLPFQTHRYDAKLKLWTANGEVVSIDNGSIQCASFGTLVSSLTGAAQLCNWYETFNIKRG